MSDTEQEAPAVAPAHTDVRGDFSLSDIRMVLGLGGVAIIAGTVLGLVLAA